MMFTVKKRDMLFSIIAHDLKNPFGSVLSFSEILLTRFHHLADDKKQKTFMLMLGTLGLFGLAFCYNKLPRHVVATKSVKEFQRQLQYGLRKGASSGLPILQLL